MDTSAVAKHCWRMGHHVDWATARVIDSSPFWYSSCLWSPNRDQVLKHWNQILFWLEIMLPMLIVKCVYAKLLQRHNYDDETYLYCNAKKTGMNYNNDIRNETELKISNSFWISPTKVLICIGIQIELAQMTGVHSKVKIIMYNYM